MRPAVARLLSINSGVCTRAQLLQVAARAAVDDEIRRGQLGSVFPRTYAQPWDVDDPDVRLRAALLSVGGEVALSHVTGLERYGLLAAGAHPIHVTAFQPRHPRGVPNELVVHRTLLPLRAQMLNGFPVVQPELAAVSSWPWLDGPAGRAPLIDGARRRLLRVPELARLAETSYWLRGVTELRALVALIVAGCESELELFGYTHVFDVDGLRQAKRQRIVVVDGKRYRVDMAFEAEMVAVELDGRAYHASPEQWEHDIARDLALATAGWLTIRLSHRRLTTQIEGCRRDVLAVLNTRRPPHLAS